MTICKGVGKVAVITEDNIQFTDCTFDTDGIVSYVESISNDKRLNDAYLRRIVASERSEPAARA